MVEKHSRGFVFGAVLSELTYQTRAVASWRGIAHAGGCHSLLCIGHGGYHLDSTESLTSPAALFFIGEYHREMCSPKEYRI